MNPSSILEFVPWLVGGLVIWKGLSVIQATCGIRSREEDRSRRDLYHLVERLVEKQIPDAAHYHPQERTRQVVEDAEVEKEALKKPQRNIFDRAPETSQSSLDSGAFN